MATSYSNPGGTGNRVAVITVTTTMSVSGSPTVLLNGVIDNSFFFNGQAISGKYLRFAFNNSTVGNQSVVIDEAKWYQDNASGQGTWQWQGSNDAVTWTNIGSTFTLGGATPFETITALNGNTTAYAYYQLLGVSGSSSSSPWLQEIEFKISGFVLPFPVVTNFANPLSGLSGAQHQIVKAPAQTTFAPTYFTPVPVAANLAGGVTGVAYTETITAQGGTAPYTYSVVSGTLPTSLSLVPSTGVIAGTPSVAGTYNFTIRVTDTNSFTGDQNFQIIITAPSAAGGGSFTYAG